MKLLRIKAIAKKEVVQILRDPLSLVMAFLMPVLLLFIFGYAITLDVNNITTVVNDLDKSRLSREFVSGLSASGYFTIVDAVDNQREIDKYLDSGRAKVAVLIPNDFSKNISTGRNAEVQVIVDGSDSNTAVIALGYIRDVELFSQKLQGISIKTIDPRIRVWYNPELKSRNFIIPGLVAVIMAMIASLLTSLTISRNGAGHNGSN